MMKLLPATLRATQTPYIGRRIQVTASLDCVHSEIQCTMSYVNVLRK